MAFNGVGCEFDVDGEYTSRYTIDGEKPKRRVHAAVEVGVTVQ